MSTTAQTAKRAPGTAEPRAIFSADGQRWSHYEGAGPVVKIVIGTPPKAGEEAKPVELSAEVRQELDAHLPTATHLHLWQVEGMKKLDALPAGLKCLDLRGCAELEILPELPAGLEMLDLGGCTALKKLPSAPPKLERFFFDGCAALRDLGIRTFLEALADAPLVEVDGSRSLLTTLDEMPRKALRKLVLAGCEKLASVEGIETFPALEHVNLSGCTALEVLPNLPPRLRYLLLHGAKELRNFMGQSINEIQRGEERENVARAFQSYRKFGNELAVMPGAKLLLLGDGNVGKTTLAKRLRWNSLNAEERAEQPELKPMENEPYTHRVEFGEWRTPLRLPADMAEKLRKQAGNANVKLNMNAAGELEGVIRLWDFGGQELYHATHRIFAKEGSVFLLLWQQKPPPVREMPEGMGLALEREEWNEWNRSRSLDYWLDYVRTLKTEKLPEVAVVCTKCPSSAPRSDWKQKAPRNHALRDAGGHPLKSYDVESVLEDDGPVRELTEWIHAACAREAESIGLLKPRFFEDARSILREIMEANQMQSDGREKVLMLEWEEWSRRLMENHQRVKPDGAPDLDGNDIETITTYLHRAGDVFQIASAGHRSVLVDQNRAAELIYEMLKPGAPLHGTVKATGGWFHGGVFDDSPAWQGLDATVRSRLVEYMLECQMIVKLADAGKSRIGRDIFLALDKWLLPSYPTDEQMKYCDHGLRDLRRKVDRVMEMMKDPVNGMSVAEKFSFETLEITEFEFRNVFAILAGSLGNEATYFRTVMQANDPWGEPGLFRFRWMPAGGDADSFTGTVDAVFVAPGRAVLERMTARLEMLLAGDKSPFRGMYQPRRMAADERDLSAAFMHGQEGSGKDFGISSSGADTPKVEHMRMAMVAEGLRARWYRDEACRLGDERELRKYMMRLNNEDRMMLVISAGYLRGSVGDYGAPSFNAEDCETNWYCAYEFADAVVRFANGTRSENDTMVVAIPDAGFQIGTFKDRAHALLNNMNAHFREKYIEMLRQGDEGKFPEYKEIFETFTAALKDEAFGKFMERFDSGAALWAYDDLAKNDCAGLIANLRIRIPRFNAPREENRK